jgi:hypothetical protein
MERNWKDIGLICKKLLLLTALTEMEHSREKKHYKNDKNSTGYECRHWRAHEMMLRMDKWCKGNMKKNPCKGDERGSR